MEKIEAIQGGYFSNNSLNPLDSLGFFPFLCLNRDGAIDALK